MNRKEYLELIKKRKELAARPEKIEEIRLNETRRRRIEVGLETIDELDGVDTLDDNC